MNPFRTALHAVALASSLVVVTAAAHAQEAPPGAPTPAPTPPVELGYAPLPTLRFGFGTHIPMNDAAGQGLGFAFDLQGGVALVPRRTGVMFLPELGYAYDGSDTRGGHFFTGGAAAFYGDFSYGAGLSSRVLVGDSHGRFAYGVRTSLVFHVLVTLFMVEIGHQWVRDEAEDRHEIRLTVSVNPVTLVAGVLGMFAIVRGINSIGSAVDTATTHPGDMLLPSSQRPAH